MVESGKKKRKKERKEKRKGKRKVEEKTGIVSGKDATNRRRVRERACLVEPSFPATRFFSLFMPLSLSLLSFSFSSRLSPARERK